MSGLQASTVAAISTPLAAGGLGVIRVSGPRAVELAAEVFSPAGSRRVQDVPGYSGVYGRVHDQSGDIDEAVALVFRAPKSYTGEDVVELSCHGGVYILQRTLRALVAAGAVPAAPGEFTKRAFLNGKLGLTQAEAVMDLIASQGDQAARAALSARDGALYAKIHGVASGLVAISGHMAAWVDFPEEDIPEVEQKTLQQALQQALDEIGALIRTFDAGQVLREGVETAIVGRPNVGKSTLMNLLAGCEKSIVTDIPGTTRDVVEDTVRLEELVLRLSDTAGLRETDDPVESVGVARAYKRIQAASLVIAVFDSSQPLAEADLKLLSELAGRPCVAVVNKTDLPRAADLQTIRAFIPAVVELSAKGGTGVSELAQAVRQVLHTGEVDTSAAMLANERQLDCAQRAAEALREACDALRDGCTLDAVGVCVDTALDALLALTGERVSDVVVDEVFSHFCVGK